MRFIQTIKKGFTLVELLIVIAIIAILSAVVAPNAFKAIEKSKVASAEADFKAIKTAALNYYSDTGSWPADKSADAGFIKDPGVNTIKGWNGPYMEKWKANNPWGGDYKYCQGNDVPNKTNGKNYEYIFINNVPALAADKLEADLDGGTPDKDDGMVRRNSTGVYLIISEQ